MQIKICSPTTPPTLKLNDILEGHDFIRDAGECGKDWEPRAADDHEIKIAAEYAAHVNSQLTGQEYKDQLDKVTEAFIKVPCNLRRIRLERLS